MLENLGGGIFLTHTVLLFFRKQMKRWCLFCSFYSLIRINKSNVIGVIIVRVLGLLRPPIHFNQLTVIKKLTAAAYAAPTAIVPHAGLPVVLHSLQ